MNIAPARGLRTVFSWAEVCELLQMRRTHVESLVRHGKLPKRSSGCYPFFQSDVNAFIARLNSGEITIGSRAGHRREMRTTPPGAALR